MVNQIPPFEIYHDPPDQDGPSTSPFVATLHSTRSVLSEIKLPNCGIQTQGGSKLKYEILASQPESPSSSDSLPSPSSLEESKENIPSGPTNVSFHKKNRTLATTSLKCNQPFYLRKPALSTFISASTPNSKKRVDGTRGWVGVNAAKEARMP